MLMATECRETILKLFICSGEQLNREMHPRNIILVVHMLTVMECDKTNLKLSSGSEEPLIRDILTRKDY